MLSETVYPEGGLTKDDIYTLEVIKPLCGDLVDVSQFENTLIASSDHIQAKASENQVRTKSVSDILNMVTIPL